LAISRSRGIQYLKRGKPDAREELGEPVFFWGKIDGGRLLRKNRDENSFRGVTRRIPFLKTRPSEAGAESQTPRETGETRRKR